MSKTALLPCPVFSHQAPTLTSSVVNDACWKFVEAMPHSLPGPVFNDLKPAVHAAILHYHAHLSSSPQPPLALADARDDSALLDAMERQRIAVVPEYEGPWDAEIYNGDEKPNHRGSGSTPREAIRAAIAAAKGEQQ